MVYRNQKLGCIRGKVVSVHRRLAEVIRWDQWGSVQYTCSWGACMHAYDGRYVIDGGVDCAYKQYKNTPIV